jgi:hypothetical protein
MKLRSSARFWSDLSFKNIILDFCEVCVYVCLCSLKNENIILLHWEWAKENKSRNWICTPGYSIIEMNG